MQPSRTGRPNGPLHQPITDGSQRAASSRSGSIALAAGAATRSACGQVVDLFAGAGGWDEGLVQLGYRATGIDTDPYACATARAAGHQRLRADVASLDPHGMAPAWGLIASPPCQAYSSAGSKLGRHDKPSLIACANDLAAGRDTRGDHAPRLRDARSLLTVEPLRWALALRPRWLAFEQVPPVLELWQLFAALLGEHGYHAWAGILSAERYGVAQTRRRAYLIASLDGPVCPPAPTHRSYNPRRPDATPEEDEQQLRPWISMAQALSWRWPALALTHANTDKGRRPDGLTRNLRYPCRTIDTSAGAWTIERLPRPRTHILPDDRHDQPPHRCDGGGRGHRPSPLLEGPSRRSLAQRRPASNADADGCGPDERGGVRLTAQQATILQGFRADYPWHGGRGRQFQQIGNAVCPPVARAVLAEAMRPTLRAQAAR
jgi:DNA (cytosine-5)-methyltransferase 1